MKSKKTKKKAALLALFVAMLCVLGTGCGGGPSIVFDERFDSNKSFLEFYKIFKKQNDDNVILSLDFDTDSRFECSYYYFVSAPFNINDLESGNLYDYKYINPQFEFWFLYTADADTGLIAQREVVKEHVIIKCEPIIYNDTMNVSLNELTYSFEKSDTFVENIPEELNAFEHPKKYIYLVKHDTKTILKIEIIFDSGSQNENKETADIILDVIKQGIIVLK